MTVKATGSDRKHGAVAGLRRSSRNLRKLASMQSDVRKQSTTSSTEKDRSSPNHRLVSASPSRNLGKHLSTSARGMSTRLFPSTDAEHFGMIQSLLYREPFWLLVATTLLNKTPGKAARPIFWKIKERYPDPVSLAAANPDTLCTMIRTLGLQRQRSKRIIKLAETWLSSPPHKGVRYNTKHYEVLDGAEATPVGLEIGHLPGCGPYAWDSWRIFCRDMLLNRATDYNGAGAQEGFEPEWKRVRPLDKELRGCLRWMWLREGYVWNPESGDIRRVTEEEKSIAAVGEC